MKNKLLICFALFSFFSCTKMNENKEKLEDTHQIPNYKLDLIKNLDLSDDIEKILFVPDNSCKGCLNQTISLCEILSANKKLKIYYFNELNLIKNECSLSKDTIKFDIAYTNYDIYGITLFELLTDSIHITYVDANNIDSVYSNLLN